MDTVLDLLLKFIGKEQIGNETTLPNVVMGGLHIAKASRANGLKCIVGVKYIDSMESYQVVYDPECHKGTILSVDEIYIYKEIPVEEVIPPVEEVIPPVEEIPKEEVKVQGKAKSTNKNPKK